MTKEELQKIRELAESRIPVASGAEVVAQVTILQLLDELERQEILANGYKTANEEAQELLNELHAENERLNKEADWLANKLHKTLVIDGKSKVRCTFGPEQWREEARKAVESPEDEALTAASGPKWAWASGVKKGEK